MNILRYFGVSLAVFVQVRHLFEACRAALNIALIWSLSGMGKHVMLQAVAVLESCRTVGPSAGVIFNAFVRKVDVS